MWSAESLRMYWSGKDSMCEIDRYIEEAIDLFRSDKPRSAEIRLCEGIERVIEGVAAELHGPGSSSISHLVHYTGTDVLFAMLDESDKEGGLRLYDTVHGNDPEEGTFLLRHWTDRENEGPWMWQESPKGDSGGDVGFELKQLVEQGLYPGHAYVLSFVPSGCDEKNNDRIVFLERVRAARGGLFAKHSRREAVCSREVFPDAVPSSVRSRPRENARGKIGRVCARANRDADTRRRRARENAVQGRATESSNGASALQVSLQRHRVRARKRISTSDPGN